MMHISLKKRQRHENIETDFSFNECVFYVLYRYSCAPGFCSQTNGLSRGDVLGCLYFCYLDMSLDELIQHVEVDDRYDEWRGTGIQRQKKGGLQLIYMDTHAC